MKFVTAWPAWLSRGGIVAPCIVVMAALPGASAVAQDQPPQYETPLYTTKPPAALDPNYGLPNFGMPGSELPQQRTMATPTKADPTAKGSAADSAGSAGGADAARGTASGTPDFFAGSTEIALPRPPTSQTYSDTPLYTTSQGSTTGEARSTTTETPLYDDGSDQAAPR
jgi:hypothetical protein